MANDSYYTRGHDVRSTVWGRLGERFGLISMRPRLVEDARVRRLDDEIEVVQASTGRVVPLSESDVRLVRQFDGTRSVAELVAGEIGREGRIDIDLVLGLIDRVIRAEMLDNFPPNIFGQLERHIARRAVDLAHPESAPSSVGARASRQADVQREGTGGDVDEEEYTTFEHVPWRPRTPLLADRAKFFRSVELLKSLDLRSIGLLAESAKEEAYPAAHNIVTEGEVADRFYVIKSGEVNVTRRDESGAAKRIAKLGPRDWFGEAGILDARLRNASVRVGPSRPAQVFSFDATVFEKIISPQIEAFRGRQLSARRRDALAAMPLFQSLATDDLERLSHVVREVHVPGAQVVFRQGDEGDRFYVIVSGSVDVVRDGVHAARLNPGDFFGETALLFTTDRTATIVAAEDSTFWTIDRQAFERIVREHLVSRRDMMPTVLNRLHA